MQPDTVERVQRVVGVVGQVIAPATVVTALLVYFGWARTSATYSVFGIDRAVLEFSLQEYVFRSIGGVFTPAAGLLLTLLLVLPAHGQLARLVGRSSERVARCVAVAASGVGGILVVLGVFGFTGVVVYAVAWPVVPLMLGFGALLLWYGPFLYSAATGRARRIVEGPALLQGAWRALLGTFLVLTLFWAVAVYAQATGLQEAAHIASYPRALPGVVIYSERSLLLDGVGVRESHVVGEEAQYRYRYDGLRLLVRGNDRYVLLPDAWRPGARAVVLPDSTTIRLEFFLGPRPTG